MRDSDTTFKVKGHQDALLSAALTRKAAEAVSVGTYSARESPATLRLLGGARGTCQLGRPRGGEGRGHIVSPRAQFVIYCVHVDAWAAKLRTRSAR